MDIQMICLLTRITVNGAVREAGHMAWRNSLEAVKFAESVYGPVVEVELSPCVSALCPCAQAIREGLIPDSVFMGGDIDLPPEG